MGEANTTIKTTTVANTNFKVIAKEDILNKKCQGMYREVVTASKVFSGWT